MDRPSQQAADAFWKTKDHRFGPSNGPPHYTLLECFKYPESEPVFTQDQCLGLEVLRRLHSPPTGKQDEKPTASLQVVMIERDLDDKLQANFLIFRQILSVLNLQSEILTLVTKGIHGTNKLRSVHNDGYIESFYFNTISALVIWTWNSRTRATKAVLIPSRANGVYSSKVIWKLFAARIEAEAHSIETPGLLRLAGELELADYLESILSSSQQCLAKVELGEFFGSKPRAVGTWSRDQDEVLKTYRSMDVLVSRLSSAQQQNDILMEILAAERQEDHGNTDSEPVHSLWKQAQSRKTDIRLLQEQAKQKLALVRAQTLAELTGALSLTTRPDLKQHQLSKNPDRGPEGFDDQDCNLIHYSTRRSVS